MDSKTNTKSVVVIPLYTADLRDFELISLKQTLTVLEKYTFIIVCPEDLNISKLSYLFDKVNYEIKRFNNQYFDCISGYNKFCLSTDFYEAFIEFEYILICQTDVFVTRDDFDFWCSKGYDYIGAPWIGTPRNFFNTTLTAISNFWKNIIGKKTKGYEHLFKVGNGGFSLRKVKKHLEIVTRHKEIIDHYQKNKDPENYHIEDVFFSLKAPKLDKDFNIPDWKVALSFCMDRKPKLSLKLNNGNIPFAIHGFNKPKVQKFWKPIIQDLSKITS